MRWTKKLALSLCLLAFPMQVMAADVNLTADTDFSGPCISFPATQVFREEETVFIASFTEDGTLAKCTEQTVSGLNDYHKLPICISDYMTEKNRAARVQAFVWSLPALTPVGAPVPLDTASVCTFYEDKPAAVSITYDDVNGFDFDSALFIESCLKPYGFRATAMLICDWIQNAEQWNALFDRGVFDLGDHSVNHDVHYKTAKPIEITKDILPAYAKLHNLFPSQLINTFASPWGEISDTAVTAIAKNHYANRTAGGGLQSANPSDDGWFKLKAYTYEDKSLEEINAWTDEAIRKRGWAIELYHNCIEGDTPSQFAIPKQFFSDHIDYLASKQDQIWEASFEDAVNYIKERQNASVSSSFVSEDTIRVQLTDTLPNDRFHVPLTVKLFVSSAWKNGAVCTQGTTVTELTAHPCGNDYYLLVNAVPDQGAVTLKKK